MTVTVASMREGAERYDSHRRRLVHIVQKTPFKCLGIAAYSGGFRRAGERSTEDLPARELWPRCCLGSRPR
jgi:hypothetical protein